MDEGDGLLARPLGLSVCLSDLIIAKMTSASIFRRFCLSLGETLQSLVDYHR